MGLSVTISLLKRCMKIIFLALSIYLQTGVNSLDVSWLPSDPDGPLPLSAKYRDSLRKLCVLIKSGQPLPAEVMEKSAILNKMCKRLASDDQNISSANFDFGGFLQGIVGKSTLIVGIVSLGWGYLLWENRRSLGAFIKKLTNWRKRQNFLKKDGQDDFISDAQLAREARLRRFAAEALKGDSEKEL